MPPGLTAGFWTRTDSPIYLGTDKITATEQGLIYYDGGGLIGRLGVYAFEDNEQLVHNDMGLFTGERRPASGELRGLERISGAVQTRIWSSR